MLVLSSAFSFVIVDCYCAETAFYEDFSCRTSSSEPRVIFSCVEHHHVLLLYILVRTDYNTFHIPRGYNWYFACTPYECVCLASRTYRRFWVLFLWLAPCYSQLPVPGYRTMCRHSRATKRRVWNRIGKGTNPGTDIPIIRTYNIQEDTVLGINCYEFKKNDVVMSDIRRD